MTLEQSFYSIINDLRIEKNLQAKETLSIMGTHIITAGYKLTDIFL